MPTRTETEITRLKRDCAEAYQAVGALAAAASLLDHPDVVRAMDNLAAAVDGRRRPHADLLPFLQVPDRTARR